MVTMSQESSLPQAVKSVSQALMSDKLLRIKSQVLAAQHDRASAINCLTEALAVARAQSALAWELRSTMALARMLSEDGQRDQARHTLALVYDRFTEGFETADLRLAHALLEDLR